MAQSQYHPRPKLPDESMRHRTLIIVLLSAVLLWLASSFVVGRGCIIVIDLTNYHQQNIVEYVVPNTTITIWRCAPSQVDNPLLDLLFNQYADTADASGPTEIAKFNAMWKDGYSMAYYPLVRDRNKWIDWTTDNRELADFAWPRFLEYLDTGDTSRAHMVLWYARQSTTVADLEAAIASDPEMQTGG